MDKLTEIIKNSTKNFTALWTSFSIAKKISFSIIAIAIIGVFISLIAVQKRETYQYLYVNISPEDASTIVTYLKKNGKTDFIVDNKGVKVPANQVLDIRLSLSQEGIPSNGVIGWEKFDEENFTRTEFEQDIQKLRAIQGELSRTISSIDGINSARVHIVLPKHSLFIRNKKDPTAAIYVKNRRGFELERKQIKGIQHLVSKSIEGLSLNNITIVDSTGKMLTDVEPTDRSAKQSRELLNFKRNIERTLEDRIKSIVGRIVGPDRIEAKVDAEVDFTEETQTISDIDPDDIAVVSKNTSGFSMEGQGLNPTGIPGSKSNVPGEQENLVANSSKAGSKRETELINYEISKKISKKTLAVGQTLRLTISAIVDGKQVYPIDGSTPDFIPRSKNEMQKIEELIKNAVGFKQKRDSLTVHNLMFQLDPFQMMEITKQKKDDRQYLSTLLASAVIALAIILFFAFIVRPYLQWLSYDPEKKDDKSIVEEYKPDLELGSMQNVQIQEDVPFDKLSPKEQVLYLARNEPKRTTEAIRVMISPNQSGA